MKSRRRMLKEALDQRTQELADARISATSAHEAKALAEQQAEQARESQRQAERQRDEAVAQHAAVLDAHRADLARLSEACGQRDAWAARAEATAAERDQAQQAVEAQIAVAVEARDAQRATELEVERYRSESEENARQVALRIEERDAALARLADLERAHDELAAEREGMDAEVEMSRAALARAEQERDDTRTAITMVRAERDARLRVATEDTPGTMIPIEQFGRAMHDDHPGAAGAERLRFEDAAFDAMREALLAITGTEPYDPDAVADKLRGALGMLDGSGSYVRPDAVTSMLLDEEDVRAIVREELAARFDAFDTSRSEPLEARAGWEADEPPPQNRMLIEHWQGVAKRLERELESTRADCKADHDRLHDRAKDAETALQQVKAERDELRPLAALADPITAQMKIVEAETRMNRAEAEFANLTRERDDAQRGYSEMHARLTRIMAERDALLAERPSIYEDGAVENALTKLGQMIGVDLRTSDESPSQLIDLAMDALKDARREAGRLKLVLDIIDERKTAAPVEVERRADGA
jgi:hypothetical protein